MSRHLCLCLWPDDIDQLLCYAKALGGDLVVALAHGGKDCRGQHRQVLLPHPGAAGLQGCSQEGEGWDLQIAAVLALVLHPQSDTSSLIDRS